ncbi:MAG: hypothetical protein U5L09_09215 [Bacteroidales bacterium]|nr:hypothetical protein [Bacteroidales bacterium]
MTRLTGCDLNDYQSQDADDVLPSPDDMRISGIDYTPHLGFTVGIVGNLRLGQYADLRLSPRYLSVSALLIMMSSGIMKAIITALMILLLSINASLPPISIFRCCLSTNPSATIMLELI